jgi:hypothetical protein
VTAFLVAAFAAGFGAFDAALLAAAFLAWRFFGDAVSPAFFSLAFFDPFPWPSSSACTSRSSSRL